MMWNKILLLLSILLFAVAVSGCANGKFFLHRENMMNKPINPKSLSIKAPTGISLPTELEVSVYIPNASSQSDSHTIRSSYYFESGVSKTFPLVFSKFNITNEFNLANEDSQAPAQIVSPTADVLVTVIEMKAYFSFYWEFHKAQITVAVFQPNGEKVGEFSGSRSVMSPITFEPQAFKNAFVKALMDILGQLVENEKFIELAGKPSSK